MNTSVYSRYGMQYLLRKVRVVQADRDRDLWAAPQTSTLAKKNPFEATTSFGEKSPLIAPTDLEPSSDLRLTYSPVAGNTTSHTQVSLLPAAWPPEGHEKPGRLTGAPSPSDRASCRFTILRA